MAFTSCTVTVNNIASLSDLPNTTDGLTSTQLKQKFDQTGTDLKTYINSTLLSELAATTGGSSASENIGGRSISAKSVIAGISAGTLYSQLNSLHTQLNSFVSGTGFIPTTGGTFTGAVEFPTGSVSIASINAGDVDTGIYFPTSGTFAVTNNGAETFRATSNNRVLIGGTTSFTTKLGTGSVVPNLQFQGTDDTASLLTSRFSADNEAPRMFFAKSRGATVGTHGSVLSGDHIGDISFGASDGDEIVEAARIRVSVDGTPGNLDMPGRISFMTTPDSSQAPTEKMRIANDGTITFNSYTTAGYLKNSAAGVLSSATSVPIGDLSGTGTGVNTFLTTPTSANLASAVTDETGSGALVFGTSPTISGLVSTSGITSTGQIALDTAGTAASPSLSFSTDLDTGIFRGAANQLAFSTNGTEALRINSVQRVLINNTTQFTTYRGATSNVPQFQIAGTSKDTSGMVSSIFSADAIGSRIFFAKSRNATIGSFTIVNNGDSLGEISFGGSHDSQIYEAARIVSEADGAPTNGSSMPGRIIFSTTASGATTVTERLRISSTGLLTSPQTYAQLVTASVRTVLVDSAGQIGNATSSIRHKEQIEDLVVNTEDILKLEAKTFLYKNDVEQNGENAVRSVGFIAEQAKQLGLTYLYNEDEDGIPDYFAYDKFSVYLLQVIKQQQQLIEQLQSRIELLESKVN